MIIDTLRANPHLLVLGLIILGLLFFFWLRFVLPSRRLQRDIARATETLHNLAHEGQVIDIDRIRNEAMTSKKLAHLWTEFAETLHPQTAPDEFGQERVVRWRSTGPAEVFFNVETLIAVELRTEYFKHQPGIFTGIGIIGTFAGLLKGLADFSVSSDPEIVRKSLDTLIHGVFEAFIVSATAITLAMLTTFYEKTSVTRRIQEVEDLCHLLDSLFESGAGEEYLARLVKAGESSATQTAQLKDALVSDLKQMLADLTHQQTEAIAASFRESSQAQIQTTEQSGDRIAQAISDSLSDPLQKIAAAVNTTTDTNGEVVTRALNEALVTFSQKMEDMFGGQMGNMNLLLQQTTSAMQSTVARFDQLANNLGDAGRNAADAMGDRLSAALEAMEARQHALNATMSEFVAQLRDMVHASQSETNTQMQEAMRMIGEKIGQMTEQLERQARLNTESHQEQQARLAENASQVANQLAAQVQASQAAMQEQLGAMLQVLREQSAQTQTVTSEQQEILAQRTETTVKLLTSQVQTLVNQMNQRIADFAEKLVQKDEQSTKAHASAQAELAEQQQVAQRTIQQQMTALLDVLREQAEQTRTTAQEQQETLTRQTQETMKGLSGQVQTIAGQMDQRITDFAGRLTQQAEQSAQAHVSAQAELAQQQQTAQKAMQQQLAAMLEVLREQAVQSQTTTAEQQTLLTRQTQETVDSLSGKLVSSLDTLDGQVKSSMDAIQQQLAAMVATLQQQADRSASASEAQQQRFLEDSQRAMTRMAERVDQSLGGLEQKMAALVETLTLQSSLATQSHQEQQNQLAEHATRLIETLSQQVQALTAQVNAAAGAMQASVTAFREVTTESTRRLEGSAQTLGLAADHFAKAGNSVNAVIQQTGQVSDKMVTASASLTQASGAVETALAHYNDAGQAMIQMVEALKTTVEVARQDASVSQSLVEQIRQAADHLKTANTEVNGVFEKVCEELANAHEAFAKNVENSLRRGNTAYQKELRDAVDYLKSAIEELGDVAEKIPGRK